MHITVTTSRWAILSDDPAPAIDVDASVAAFEWAAEDLLRNAYPAALVRVTVDTFTNGRWSRHEVKVWDVESEAEAEVVENDVLALIEGLVDNEDWLVMA